MCKSLFSRPLLVLATAPEDGMTTVVAVVSALIVVIIVMAAIAIVYGEFLLKKILT